LHGAALSQKTFPKYIRKQGEALSSITAYLRAQKPTVNTK